MIDPQVEAVPNGLAREPGRLGWATQPGKPRWRPRWCSSCWILAWREPGWGWSLGMALAWLLVSPCLGGPVSSVRAEWVWTAGTGWYNARAAVQSTAEELLAGARQAFEARSYADAAHGCRLLLVLYPSSEHRAAALELQLEAQYLQRDFDGALETIDRILAGQPDADTLQRVIYRKYEIGTSYLTGTRRRFLGIPYSGGSYGAELLDSIVQRYPYLHFSDDALVQVAAYYFRRGRYEEAEFIYERLLREYPKSEWAGLAEYQIGNAALRRLKGVEYDLAPLAKAREHFRRYLRDHPGGDRVEEAQRALAEIDRLTAERLYRIGVFYLRERQQRAGVFYLQKVHRDHPHTEAAAQALERLRTLEPESVRGAP